jgi:hypothetical protein
MTKPLRGLTTITTEYYRETTEGTALESREDILERQRGRLAL